MFKRLQRLWKLSKKEPKALDLLDGLTDKQIMQLPDAGDGKAEFIDSGTEEEFKDFERQENGTKSWYERLKNL